MSKDLKSKLVTDFSASEFTNRRMANAVGIPTDLQITYTVLKVYFENKIYYCCLSGGRLENGDALFTDVGRAAFEALLALPFGKDAPVVMQEVKIGVTPLTQKVKSTLRKLPSGSKVCFFGDMAGELDGVLIDVFNLSGSTEG